MKRKHANLEFLTPNSLISPHLFCPICKEIFQDPRRLFCGHTFCAFCIRKWLKVHEKCPECRAKVEKSRRNELPRDLIAKKIVDDLEVSCVNAGLCEWTGSFSKLDAHLKQCSVEKLKKIHINREFSKENTIVIEENAGDSEVILVEEEENDEISLGNSQGF